MAQVVFERAVQHEIEDALIPHFEMIEEFSLGDVLLRHHKPHWYSSGKSLDYTGEPLTGILAQEDVNELRVHTKTKKLHADVVTLQSKLSVNIEHDAKVQYLVDNNKFLVCCITTVSFSITCDKICKQDCRKCFYIVLEIWFNKLTILCNILMA